MAGFPAHGYVRADAAWRGVDERAYSTEAAFEKVAGESLAIRAAIALGLRVAHHPHTTVLLHGETGTGKELFARGIHHASASTNQSFVAVNCSAIPENLLESELFGHERGAFTDARTQKRGLLELAGKGTLFLDEIDQLPTNVQPKLLRVLEEKCVRRLGGVEEYPVRCRIIAGTNSDLSAEVANARFREDLFYRLSVFRIELPPLRMRGRDIDLLASHFIEMFCRERGVPTKTLTDDALEILRTHPWPGNIRELKNAIERALIVCDDAAIQARHIQLQVRVNLSNARVEPRPGAVGSIDVPANGMKLEEAERLLIEITLRLTGYNHTRSAEILGISRPTLLRKINEYKLED